MFRYVLAAGLSLVSCAVTSPSTAQEAPRTATNSADRIVNDPRVPALVPYGLNLPPQVRSDKDVQFGKAIRLSLSGQREFWRIGIVSPTLKPVKKGDRIVIAFWAKASGTKDGAPDRIGRVQLESTPVVRTIFEKGFDIAPAWTMYQLAGVADRDYPPGTLNAALHLDSARQVLDIGPVFILNYGQASP